MTDPKPDLLDALDLAKAADLRVKNLVSTRRVRITGKWRDQPIGHSKPLQTGKIATVVTGFCEPSDNTVCLWLEGYSCSIGLDEVEFLD